MRRASGSDALATRTYLQQLTADGRIVAPIGDLDLQELVVRDARGRVEHHGPVRFVPLRGEGGFRG